MITQNFSKPLDSLLEQGLIWTPTASALRDASEVGASSSFVATTIPEIDHELGGGLLRNVIHTFSGSPLDAITATPILLTSYLGIQCRIQSNEQKPVVWIGPPQEWPTPWLLSQITEDMSPSSCLFVRITNNADLVWAIKTALSSRSLSAVVAPAPRLHVRETQSLSVLARSGGCSAFFYREKPDLSPSAYYSCWIIKARKSDHSFELSSPSFSLHLKKTKGKQPSRTEWPIIYKNGRLSVHDSTISPTNAVPLSLSPQPLDRENISGHSETERSASGRSLDSPVHRTA